MDKVKMTQILDGKLTTIEVFASAVAHLVASGWAPVEPEPEPVEKPAKAPVGKPTEPKVNEEGA